MQFKQGASVLTEDGKQVGHIDRVVIDPRTKDVTHIVIRKGTLFTEDKVIPRKLIAAGKGEAITLRINAAKLNELPDFEETHYILLNEQELGRGAASAANVVPALYWYAPYPETPMVPYAEPPYGAETRLNIPAETVAVKEGAQVTTFDDQHIGNVEQVLTGNRGGHVTHFLVSKGVFLKEKKMIPVEWIDKLTEDEVHLAVSSRLIEELPSFEHA